MTLSPGSGTTSSCRCPTRSAARSQRETFLGVKAEVWVYSLAIMATMLLCGLWHGAAWTFVLWGGAHGIFLTVERATKWPRRIRKLPLGAGVGVLLVLLQVWTAWVLFRSESLGQAWIGTETSLWVARRTRMGARRERHLGAAPGDRRGGSALRRLAAEVVAGGEVTPPDSESSAWPLLLLASLPLSRSRGADLSISDSDERAGEQTPKLATRD